MQLWTIYDANAFLRLWSFFSSHNMHSPSCESCHMLYSLWPEELQLSYLLQPPGLQAGLQADVLQVTLHASARGCK